VTSRERCEREDADTRPIERPVRAVAPQPVEREPINAAEVIEHVGELRTGRGVRSPSGPGTWQAEIELVTAICDAVNHHLAAHQARIAELEERLRLLEGAAEDDGR
jgi:hypothetical protein